MFAICTNILKIFHALLPVTAESNAAVSIRLSQLIPVVVEARKNRVAVRAVVEVAGLHVVAGAARSVAGSHRLGSHAGVALGHEDGARVNARKSAAAAAGVAGVDARGHASVAAELRWKYLIVQIELVIRT